MTYPPLPNWQDRVVLITGATAGFGTAFAHRYAAAGAKLIICGRRTERLEALADQLSVPVHVLTLDVRDRFAVETGLGGLPAAFADVDVLINNAGLALGLEPAPEASLDDWEIMVDTNLKGLMTVTRTMLPGMVARNRGHIVNIGSVAGTYPYPGGNMYGATKAAVAQFSRNLAADLLNTAIRVTNIEPGLCGGSEFSQVRFHGDEDRAAKVYDGAVFLTPDDVAEAVFWTTALPAHVNITRVEMMPVGQASAGLAVYRPK